jgi:hypothetical protein
MTTFEKIRINNMDWILEPNSKGWRLGISNIRYVEKPENLEKDNIKAVISVLGEKELILPESIEHLRILITDSPREEIKIFF